MDRSVGTTKLLGAESMDGSVCPRTKAVPDENDSRKVEAALLEEAQRLPVLPRDGNVPLTTPYHRLRVNLPSAGERVCF